MDFRSNEAGRTEQEPKPGATAWPNSQRSNPNPLTPPIVAAGASSSTMKIETLTIDFTDEQKRYLEGFTSGLQISRVGRGLGGGNSSKANVEPSGPEAAHIKAQDRVTASGKKLVDQEKFKREQHPFDAYPRLKQQALDNAPPSPADKFRWRYYGLF
jgi:ferredoxin-nitrite reductase